MSGKQQDVPEIVSSGEPLVSADLWIADPAADEGHRPPRTLSEIQPDGESVELPEGDQHHDELANTDPDNHGSATQAAVHTGPDGEPSPQGYGWDESSLTEANGPEDESSGEPLIKPPSDDGEQPAPVVDDPAPKPRKRASKSSS